MMSEQNSMASIIVAGDVTIDWHILSQRQSNRAGTGWNPSIWTRACGQRGGALLLADLIEEIARRLSPDGGIDVVQKPKIAVKMHPSDRRYHHSYAIFSQFSEKNSRAWRVDQFLGYDHSTEEQPLSGEKQQGGRVPSADIVILDDANLGFRDNPNLWPDAIAADATPNWILVKMAKPVAQGLLWTHLQEHHADRLITIIPVEDLRHTEVHISRGLSWERTAQDVAWELIHNPCVNSLSSCHHVIISFGTAGAILMKNDVVGEKRALQEFKLFFDPLIIEGMWQQNHPGQMIGYTICLTAGIARQLILSVDGPDIPRGVQSGLSAMRSLHIGGFDFESTKDCQLSFPIDRIVDVLEGESNEFAEVPIENPVFSYEMKDEYGKEKLPRGWWTILEDRYHDNLAWVAEQVVLKGADVALGQVPQGRFGHLLTVDRQEIESFRSIHTLVSEYLSKDRQKRPLSIAVFGAPGSGKSFGITQVANSLTPGRMEVLEFNLSQFGGTDEIIDALHRVRDISLSGMIPLVFWDEFDSSHEGVPLGWLRYFLAPMQDGAFRQGQMVHPIGRAIFVFARGRGV